MLQALIAQGEHLTLEFKSTIESPQKIAKTLVAFANTKGGTLLVGIEDDGEISGIFSEQEEMEKIEQAAEFICHPPIDIEYESKQQKELHVLLIRIAESTRKPHVVLTAQGEAFVYMRVHDKNVPVGKQMTDVLERDPVEPDKALLQSPNVKTIIAYLQTNEFITPKRFAKLINISERRAAKLLIDLMDQHVLVVLDKEGGVFYALKG